MPQKNELHELLIDAMSSDGAGIGRLDGKTVFVPFSAVGDRIKVRIVKARTSHSFGIIEDMLSPSPDRVPQHCKTFGKCGGCAFRHVRYKTELAYKKEFVAHSFSRIARLDPPINDTVPSPLLSGYRNKIQLPVFSKDGALSTGYFAKRSHRIVPFVDGCDLQPRQLTEVAAYALSLLTAQSVPSYDERTGAGVLRHLMLRESHDGSILLCLVQKGGPRPHEEAFARKISDRFPMIRTVTINRNDRNTNAILGASTRVLTGDGYLYDRLFDVSLRLSTESFFQINRGAAEKLYQKIEEVADMRSTETLLDLYCGVGSIGLFLAKRARQVIGVETVNSAVLDARANAHLNNIENAIFHHADAKQAAAHLIGQQIDCIITDPPRKGCDPDTIQSMLEIHPSRIVMVSCNPATLARDTALLHQGGYRIEEVTPIDLFPRTQHVETVVLMSRKDK